MTTLPALSITNTMSLPSAHHQQQGDSQKPASQGDQPQDPRIQLPAPTSSERDVGAFSPLPGQSSMGTPSDQMKASPPPSLRSDLRTEARAAPPLNDPVEGARHATEGMSLSGAPSSEENFDRGTLQEAYQMLPGVLSALWKYKTGEDDEDQWMGSVLDVLEMLCVGLRWEETRKRFMLLKEAIAESKDLCEADDAADDVVAKEMASGEE